MDLTVTERRLILLSLGSTIEHEGKVLDQLARNGTRDRDLRERQMYVRALDVLRSKLQAPPQFEHPTGHRRARPSER